MIDALNAARKAYKAILATDVATASVGDVAKVGCEMNEAIFQIKTAIRNATLNSEKKALSFALAACAKAVISVNSKVNGSIEEAIMD